MEWARRRGAMAGRDSSRPRWTAPTDRASPGGWGLRAQRQAAVDDEAVAGDVVALVRGEEEGAAGDVDRLAEAAHGRLLLPDLADVVLVEVLAGHAGVDRPGQDVVRRDAELAQLQRQRARQPGDAGLRGGVGGESVVRALGHHRGD